MDNYPLCKLCEERHELCDSHALPMAMFRQILRKKESAGKLIVITDDEKTPIHYSSDSWSTLSLCKNCEGLLNEKYDSFGIKFFQGGIVKPIKSDGGVLFKNLDTNRLKLFILSILWRMHVSEHKNYAKAIIPEKYAKELRLVLLEKSNMPKNFMHVRINRLHDMGEDATLELSDFSDFVITPFIRMAKESSSYTICFVLFGFFVEVFLPRIPIGFRNESNIIGNNKNEFFAPFIQFSEVPEILSVAVSAVRKDIEGISRIK